MKDQFRPDYLVEPIEIIADMCLESMFSDLAIRVITRGITEENVFLLTEKFPDVPESFFLNLQKQYDENKERLEKKGKQNNE